MIATDLGVALVAVLVLVVVAMATLSLRRRVLARGGGTVELSLRLKDGADGRGWVLGVGRFDGDSLQWYRVFSLAMRPRRTLSRRDLSVLRRREPDSNERFALLSGAVVMECRSSAGTVDLAMVPSAVTGFLAWLEARPPGATLPRHRH
ncbi:MAG: hypothetical protein QOE99_2575 [Actinomycetota bacterium]|jgi:hypothetical protein|nr:hypothetical protein [Actinomycetota bacterium]